MDLAQDDKNQKDSKAPPEEELEQTPGARPAPEGEQAAAEAPAAEQEPSELDLLREDKKTLEERNLRLMAEFDNFRKRTAKEKEGIYGDAVANTLRDFLPVLDNFQRAMESPCGDDEFKKGMDLIYKGLWEAMTALGVEEIGETGVPFDPDLHNAVMHIEDEALGKNVVAQVLQKGYKIGDKVLRYAMVQAAN